MTSSAQPVGTKGQSFPTRREFDELLKREKWEKLLFLPYDNAHLTELAVLLPAFTSREGLLTDWIISWEDSRTPSARKRLADIIKRFFVLVHMLASVRPEALASLHQQRAIVAAHSIINILQRLLIIHEFREELELFRETLFSQLFDFEKRQVKMDHPPYVMILLPSTCYFSSTTPRPYFDYGLCKHMINMYGMPQTTTSQSFISRCKRELEALVPIAEAVNRLVKGDSGITLVNSVLNAFTSILVAARLETPVARRCVVKTPIPPGLVKVSEVGLRRLFELLFQLRVFATKATADLLANPAVGLPEFWSCSGGRPLSCILELLWDGLKTESSKLTLELSTLQTMMTVLRNVAYVSERGSLNQLEERLVAIKSLAEKIGLKTPASKDTTSEPSQYPALALLMSTVIERVAHEGLVHRSIDARDMYQTQLELLYSMLFLTNSPPGTRLLAEVMLTDKYGALRTLVAWIGATLGICKRQTTLFDREKGKGRGDAKTKDIKQEQKYNPVLLIRNAFAVCASLNVLFSTLQEDETRKRVLRPFHDRKLYDTMLMACEFGMDLEEMRIIEPGLTESEAEIAAYFDPKLYLHSTRFCALSVLNWVLFEAPPTSVKMERDVLRVLFSDGSFCTPSPNEQSLAILALAQMVKDSPENWKELQAFRTTFKRRLSDLCLGATSVQVEGFTLQRLSCTLEALAVFQYMANGKNEDDGNKLGDRQEYLEWRPIGACVSALAEIFTPEPLNDNHMHLAGLGFQLLGNYAVNVAREKRSLFGEDEVALKGSREVLLGHTKKLFAQYLALAPVIHFEYCETTVSCCFAMANLTAVRDPVLNRQLVPEVDRMVCSAGFIVGTEMQKEANLVAENDLLQKMIIDDLVALASKLIINTLVAIKESQMDLNLLGIFVLAAIKRARLSKCLLQKPRQQAALYPLLAVQSLARGSPENKLMLAELGGIDELTAGLTLARTEAERSWLECVASVFWTLMVNNPHPLSSDIKAYFTAFRPARPLKQILASLGVEL